MDGLKADDVVVYLDTTALIDFIEAMSASWHPTPRMGVNGQRRLAAAQLFFYSRRPCPRDDRMRTLVVSRIGREEISRRGGLDWTESVFQDLDGDIEAPPESIVQSEAKRLEGLGIKSADAAHLARAALARVHMFVTDDRSLQRKSRLAYPSGLCVVGVVEAAKTLGIRPGERPPIKRAQPVAGCDEWWIP